MQASVCSNWSGCSPRSSRPFQTGRHSPCRPWGARQRPAQAQYAAVAAAAELAGLLEWSRVQGANVERVACSRDVVDGHQILVAVRDVAAGEALMTVPEAAWVSLAAVARSPIGPLVASMEPWLQLALHLLHCRFGSGARSPYIDSLPERLDSPLFWSERELGELSGTQLLTSVQSYLAFFRSRWEELDSELFSAQRQAFPEAVCSWERFLWAVATVRGRAHAPLEEAGLALVPLADGLRHRRGRRARAAWRLKGGGPFGMGGRQLVVEAVAPMRKGEEVTMDYAPAKLDSVVLLDHGVVDASSSGSSSSSEGAGYALSLTLPEDDLYYADKEDILQLSELQPSVMFTLRPGVEPEPELWAFLRLMQMAGADSFLLEGIFRNEVWGHLQLPVSAANEAGVCQAMIGGAAEALRGYPTTIDQDLALLRGGAVAPGSRAHSALLVRLGEKEALDSTLQYFEARQSQLAQLEYYGERRLRRLKLIDDSGRTTYDGFFEDGIA